MLVWQHRSRWFFSLEGIRKQLVLGAKYNAENLLGNWNICMNFLYNLWELPETNIHRDVPLMVQENKGKWNQWGEERLCSDYRFVRASKDVLGFLALLLVLLPWLWQVTGIQFRRHDMVMEAALLISNSFRLCTHKKRGRACQLQIR